MIRTASSSMRSVFTRRTEGRAAAKKGTASEHKGTKVKQVLIDQTSETSRDFRTCHIDLAVHESPGKCIEISIDQCRV
jgi:hypothetical protein